jgi:hypothetical protein
MSTFESIVTSELNSGTVNTGVDIQDPTGNWPYDTFDRGSYIEFEGLGSMPINSDITAMSMNKGSHFHNMPIVNIYTNPTPFDGNLLREPMREHQTYEIMLYSKEYSDPRAEIVTSRNLIPQKRQKTVINVETWNLIQAVTEPYPEKVEDVLSAEDAIGKWGLLGPLVSEEGADEWLRYSNSTKKPQRLYNNTQYGYCACLNYWGTQIIRSPQCFLYLILKKKPAQKVYRPDAYQAAVSSEELVLKTGGYVVDENAGAADNSGNAVTPRPFQLEFWADPVKQHPLPEDLEYRDEFGFRRYGIAIRLGQYHNSGSTNDFRNYEGRDSYSTSVTPTPNKQVIWIQWHCAK